MYEFVTDEAGVTAEKECQDQPRSETVEKLRFGQEDQDQDAGARHQHLGHREHAGALTEQGCHERVRLDHSVLQQLQGHECVDAAEQHDADREKEQPRVVPVEEQDVGVFLAAQFPTAR